MADTIHELPVGYEVTPASVAEQPVAHQLIRQRNHFHPDAVDRCKVLSGDRGYDTRPFIEELCSEYRIKGVIDIRNTWRDEPETSRLLGDWDNVALD